MAKVFNLNEVVKFAIEREQEAYDLYKELAEKSDHKPAKELFRELSHEEEQHKIFYYELLKRISETPSSKAPSNDEYDGYIQELIRSNRSVAPFDSKKLSDINMVADYACAREKDSILFYLGLKNYVPVYEQENIDKIIRAEAKHISKILSLKHSMQIKHHSK